MNKKLVMTVNEKRSLVQQSEKKIVGVFFCLLKWTSYTARSLLLNDWDIAVKETINSVHNKLNSDDRKN